MGRLICVFDSLPHAELTHSKGTNEPVEKHYLPRFTRVRGGTGCVGTSVPLFPVIALK